MDQGFLREWGKTPWAKAELMAGLEYALQVRATPRDDWDRGPRRFSFRNGAGAERLFTLNPDVIETQIGLWLTARMREQGIAPEVQQRHLWRFIESIQFIRENDGQLRQCGLVIDDPDEPSAIQIEESLIGVLAVAPYDGVRVQASDPIPSFHVERVIAAAKAAMERGEGA